MAKLTPLMRQYWDIKSMYPGFLLFFRMGDFFELFHEDAQIVSQICGLHLTMRNKKAEDETRMCGLPHFSIAPHVNKLLALGHRVALCDQVEDPKLAKGLVKRAVTQILTPGMVYDPLTLDEKRSHHVVARDEQSIAWIDASSGEAGWMQVPKEEQDSILALLNVVEEVRPEEVPPFDPDWNVFLGGASFSSIRNCLAWVARVQPQVLQYLEIFQEKLRQSGCYLSPTAAAHLEIFETSLGPEASLFRALDECRTPAGSRLLRQWLTFPLRDADPIQLRLDSVAAWRKDHARLQAFRQSLSWIGDVERKLSRLASPQAMPVDLRNIAESILKLRAALVFLDQGELLSESALLAEKILSELREDLPSTLSEAHLFRRGVSESLDELMDLTDNLQSVLAQLEKSEKELTGIGSLKIRYNQVFGYYIEVTNTHLQKVPERYKRKQTLSNAERFYTDELLELERKVLSAQAKRNALEKEMWTLRLKAVLSLSGAIKKSIQVLAPEDVLAGFAWISLERNYVRPSFHSNQLKLVRSRHPLLELKKSFVVQDNSMDFCLGEVLLLTGPNMAGKSTLMRQLALICLMAQVGCFVPAEEAVLPLFDRILTRIGAHDQILKGRSTFMVEMLEMAEILQPATGPSLIVLDEVGRGTSTYDGLSLAQALLEEFLQKSRGFVVFATHYHELTGLQHPRLRNAHLRIEIRGDELHFLHQLVPGPAGKSYGIQVAKKAGLPNRVLRRAEALLRSLESPQQLSLDWHSSDRQSSESLQASVVNPFQSEEALQVLRELRDEVLGIDPNSITPLAALQRWDQWKQRLKEHEESGGSDEGRGISHA